MCDPYLSVTRIRCPDCRKPIMLPYEWCPEQDRQGYPDEAAAQEFLREHALEMPILHPTLLPEHHLIRRPA